MLRREDAVLVVIDVQGRLLPYIHEADATVGQIIRLVQGFRILGAPILVTEQYTQGLGPTDPRIVEALSAAPHEADATGGEPAATTTTSPFDAIEKMSFSCAAHPAFIEVLEGLGRRQVVLCGIESHVCVQQTALHLVEAGYDVHLAADAVSSRSPRNVEIALRRMAQEGVLLTSTESAVFEMLQVCGTAEFKRWSRVIR